MENDEKPKSVSQAETAVARPVASSPPAPKGPSVAKAKSSDQPLILPNLNADYLDNPAPAYPEEARARGEQGRIMVRALINTQGTVSQLLVQRSSGYASLDQAALATVKDWRFVPARRGENAVAAWVVVPIAFSLEG
ncbi:MAG: energy transducer TonB [Methylosarcina sp.]